MATAIGKVAAVFTASTSGLTAGVNTAKGALSSMESTVKSIHGKLTALTAIEGAKVFGGLIVSAKDVAASMISAGHATAEMIDEQSKAAAKIGMPLEAFRALADAADLAGISQSKVTGAVQKMGVALVKAGDGSKSAIKAFESLGLSADELLKMSPEKAFQVIAEQIAKLPTPAERTAAAIQIFGKAGKDLGPLFEGGAVAIKQAAEEATIFGTALDTVSGKQVEEMNDAWTRMGKAFEGFRIQVVAAFAPAVTAGIEQLIGTLKEAGGMKEVALVFAETVGMAVIDLVDGAMHFAAILKDALGLVKGAFDTIKSFRGFMADVQAYGHEAVGNLEWFANRSQENDLSLGQRKKAAELHAESTRLYREANGLPPLDASGKPKNESDMRRALRENLERMRGSSAESPSDQGGQPAKPSQADERKRPVTEETGQKQVNLLTRIANALGVQAVPPVVQIAGAPRGN